MPQAASTCTDCFSAAKCNADWVPQKSWDMVANGRLHPQIGVEASWTAIAEVAQRLLSRQIAGKAVLHVSL